MGKGSCKQWCAGAAIYRKRATEPANVNAPAWEEGQRVVGPDLAAPARSHWRGDCVRARQHCARGGFNAFVPNPFHVRPESERSAIISD